MSFSYDAFGADLESCDQCEQSFVDKTCRHNGAQLTTAAQFRDPCKNYRLESSSRRKGDTCLFSTQKDFGRIAALSRSLAGEKKFTKRDGEIAHTPLYGTATVI
jgi:hypothetical protein